MPQQKSEAERQPPRPPRCRRASAAPPTTPRHRRTPRNRIRLHPSHLLLNTSSLPHTLAQAHMGNNLGQQLPTIADKPCLPRRLAACARQRTSQKEVQRSPQTLSQAQPSAGYTFPAKGWGNRHTPKLPLHHPLAAAAILEYLCCCNA